MQTPWHLHFAIVCCIIQNILDTFSHGLFFPSGSSLQLQAYCDVDWAGCPWTRKFTIEWCLFLGDAFISWECKKHDYISESSTEIKYRAMFVSYSKIIWLCGLFTELGLSQVHPTPLHIDNTNTIQIWYQTRLPQAYIAYMDWLPLYSGGLWPQIYYPSIYLH